MNSLKRWVAQIGSTKVDVREVPLKVIAVTVFMGVGASIYGGWRAFYFQSSFLSPIAFTTDERPTAEVFSKFLQIPQEEILVGIHAFHDFLISFYWGSLGNPWVENELDFWPNHSPLAMLLGRAWNAFPYSTARDLNLWLMALAMLVPVAVSLRRMSWAIALLAMSVTVASGPFIASLDRGNYQGYIPVLLFAFGYFALKGRWAWAGFFVAFAASFKLYPVILLLVFVAERRWRALFGTIAGLAIFNVLLFFFFEGPVLESLHMYLAYVTPILGQQESELLSYNVSFTGGVLHALLFVDFSDVAVFLAERNVIVVLLGFLLVAPILWMRRSVPFVVRVIAAMSLTILITPVVFPYTVNWVIAAFALILISSHLSTDGDKSPSVSLTRLQSLGLVLLVGLLMAFYPVFIPGTYENGYPAGALTLVVPVAIGLFAVAMWSSHILFLRQELRSSRSS